MKQFIIIEKLSLCVCLFPPFHLLCVVFNVKQCNSLSNIGGGREKCKFMACKGVCIVGRFGLSFAVASTKLG